MLKENTKLKNIFLAGFLLSLQVALTTYVNSSFLSLFLTEKSVGLLYTIGSLASIFALLFIPKILRKIGAYKFLLWSVGLNALALLSLSVFENAYVLIPVFVLYFTLSNVLVFSLDELLQIFSVIKVLGKVRGLYLAIVSSAWVLSQIILGKVLNNFSFPLLYFISFEIMIVLFILSYLYLKDLPDPNYDRAPIWPSLKKFFKNKNLARAYEMNFLLQFFYAFMIIYTPIYLNAHLGFSWGEISLIFTIMLTPFVFMPFPLGKYSDKIGERKMLMLGFTLASLATIFLFFIKWHEVWVWALALFVTRLGASTIEIMSDVYFFKHIKSEEDEFIGVYRNSSPVAYVLAPLAAFLIFIFAPSFNFIFLVLGVLLLFGLYLSFTIRTTDI